MRCFLFPQEYVRKCAPDPVLGTHPFKYREILGEILGNTNGLHETGPCPSVALWPWVSHSILPLFSDEVNTPWYIYPPCQSAYEGE